jgi:hypothetical protein
MSSIHLRFAVLVVGLAALSACTPAPKYHLILPTEALIVARGTSLTFTLGVQRLEGYAKDALVTTSASPVGVTITPEQASIAGNSQVYTISVSGSVSPGPAYINLEPDVAGYGSGGSIPITVQ